MPTKPFCRTLPVIAALLAFLPLSHAAAQEPTGTVSAPTADAKTDAAPVTLAVPFAVGKVYRYKSTLEISNANIKITAEVTRRETTTAVKENGEVLAQLVEEGGKAVINGMENPLPAGKPINLLMDRYNRLLLFNTGEADGGFFAPPISRILALADRIAFPRLPVKPGDTWETEVRNPTGKSRRIVIKTTYHGTETREGATVWKVTQTLAAPTEDGTLEAELIAYLDPASGQLLQGDQTLKNVPTAAGVVTWTGKLARL